MPVITHPERLTYIDSYYDKFAEASAMGAWLQITGGSMSVRATGQYGMRIAGAAAREMLIDAAAANVPITVTATNAR